MLFFGKPSQLHKLVTHTWSKASNIDFHILCDHPQEWADVIGSASNIFLKKYEFSEFKSDLSSFRNIDFEKYEKIDKRFLTGCVYR